MMTLDKTQQILNAVGTISVKDFETVLHETLKELDDELTVNDLMNSLMDYIQYFDDDILKAYNDQYSMALDDYESTKEWLEDTKEDLTSTQDEIDDAEDDVIESKDELDELREMPDHLVRMTDDEYSWLFDHLKDFDRPLGSETLEDVEIKDAEESQVNGDVLEAFLKLSWSDRQVVLNKKY